LLLDAHFAPADIDTPEPEHIADATWDRLSVDAGADDIAAVVATPVEHVATDDSDLLELDPPHIADWETVAPQVVHAVEAVDASEPVLAAPAPVAQAEPLDLSAARLDELLARLEAGLERKAAAATAPAASAVVAEVAAPTAIPAAPIADAAVATTSPRTSGPANDPAFPHDPALAAALATLRRLNQKAG
jgi:hypothetical protein